MLLGVVGRLDFPGLTGSAASGVLVAMIETHAPGILAGLLAAGVLAAIMSSLDSQVLAIGTMFTQDVVHHYGFKDHMSERQQITYARLFVAGILVITFACSLVVDRSIFRLAVWSFTGFASLFPVILAALFWRRASAVGVITSNLTVVVLWIYFLSQSWSDPAYSVGGTGLMTVAVTLLGGILALGVGSALTSPVPDEEVTRVLGSIEEAA